jgi:hypothetical protein
MFSWGVQARNVVACVSLDACVLHAVLIQSELITLPILGEDCELLSFSVVIFAVPLLITS